MLNYIAEHITVISSSQKMAQTRLFNDGPSHSGVIQRNAGVVIPATLGGRACAVATPLMMICTKGGLMATTGTKHRKAYHPYL